MYVLINRDNMRLLFKHQCPRTLANLGHIEDREGSQHIFPVDDATSFKVFSDLELMLLYKSIVGEPDCAEKRRNHLIQIIWDLTQSAKVTKANPNEAQAQADHIPENSKLKYKFAGGSFKPALTDDLFETKPIKVERNMEQEKLATAGVLPSLKRVSPEVIAAATAKMKQGQPTTQKKPVSGPKAGTAKSIIWNTADDLWEKAGKPKDNKVVLLLRKEIMNLLEKDEGIKRSSASSELGQWSKARII